jgi:NitT/TauT family transport system substrate-binding protein
MKARHRWLKASLVFLALLLLATACGGDDTGDDTTTDTGDDTTTDTDDDTTTDTDGAEPAEVAWVQPVPPSVIYFPGIVAEELGFFAEENIEAELLTAGDITEAALIDQGDADVAFTGFAEVMEGVRAGIDYDVVYDGNHLSVEQIAVPVDSELEDMSQLEGTTVGLASDSDLAFLNVALSFAGLSEDDVDTVVTGGAGAIMANEFENDNIQAFAGAASDFAAMEGAGLELRFITPEEMRSNPGGSAIVLREQIAERPDVLEGFFRAWAKGPHVGAVAPEVVEAVGRKVAPEEWAEEAVVRASMESAIERNTPSGDTYGELRPDVWQSAVQQLVDAGQLDENVPTDEYLNDQFIAAANDFDRDEVEAQARAWLEENG